MFQIFSSLFGADKSADCDMPRVREARKSKFTPKRLREYHDDEEVERPANRRVVSEAIDPKNNEYNHGKGGSISDRRIIFGIVHYRV